MPIQIQAPNGDIVEFPDGTSDDVMTSAMRKTYGGPNQKQDSPQPPSTLGDMAKSFGSGLLRGASDLVGLPGTIQNAFDNSVSNLTGIKAPPPSQLSGESIAKGLSAITGGAPDYAPQTTPGKYAQTAGEFVPGAVALGGSGSVLGNAIRYGVVPGVTSEAAGQATQGTTAEPYARIAGAMLGPSVVTAAEHLVTPLPVSAERAAANTVLANEGVDLTAGQATGRKTLKYAESELGGGAAENFMERQGEQFTRAALARAGVNADRATPEVMDQAFTRIGGDFDTLAANNRMIPDQGFAHDITTTLRDYNNLVPESARAPVVENTILDIGRMANGGLGGETYQAIRSRLDKAARSSTRTDPQLSEALFGIRNAMDDAMERSIAQQNPQDLGAWQTARREYRNMLVLEKAASGAGENVAQGLISPSQLRNATVQQNRRGYVRGDGDFADLARAGESVLKPLPQSGTAPRTAVRNMMGGNSALIGAGVGGAVGSIPGAVIGGLAPYAAGRALLSRPARAYLANQLIQPTGLTDPRIASVVAALLSRSSDQGQLTPTR